MNEKMTCPACGRDETECIDLATPHRGMWECKSCGWQWIDEPRPTGDAFDQDRWTMLGACTVHVKPGTYMQQTFSPPQNCPACDGHGAVDADGHYPVDLLEAIRCPVCNGTGKVEPLKQRWLSIDIELPIPVVELGSEMLDEIARLRDENNLLLQFKRAAEMNHVLVDLYCDGNIHDDWYVPEHVRRALELIWYREEKLIRGVKSDEDDKKVVP